MKGREKNRGRKFEDDSRCGNAAQIAPNRRE
jgi:hypothetical protein